MEADLVRDVRRFNRLAVQRLGALETSYLDRGRPLGEARMLFEIGPTGGEVRTLRERLGLDSGYVSRLLRSLEAQGLVEVWSDGGDGRVRRAALTEKGREEFAAYDAASDALAQSMLSPLSQGQRQRLVAAMGEIERLIRAAAVEVRFEAPEEPEARWCLRAYFEELADRFETGFDARLTNSASDEELTPPAGYLALARLDGAPVGCGALKVIDASIGEIKRMWTAPAARGLGVARRILQILEAQARAVGLKEVRLETNASLRGPGALSRQRLSRGRSVQRRALRPPLV